jgi:hypothetical protein
MPHPTIVPNTYEQEQVKALSSALKEMMKEDLLNGKEDDKEL